MVVVAAAVVAHECDCEQGQSTANTCNVILSMQARTPSRYCLIKPLAHNYYQSQQLLEFTDHTVWTLWSYINNPQPVGALTSSSIVIQWQYLKTESAMQLTSGCIALNAGKSITVIWLWNQHHTLINKSSSLASSTFLACTTSSQKCHPHPRVTWL